tara:strand:- start:859 stop:963 length:105 start_codon:yes stop_codon:yes gene_type:complete
VIEPERKLKGPFLGSDIELSKGLDDELGNSSDSF